MRTAIIILFILSKVSAKCPAPFQGEYGPCMKTCGIQKRCSDGLWCCDTPCGGNVCKIPNLPAPTRRPPNHHQFTDSQLLGFQNPNPYVHKKVQRPLIPTYHPTQAVPSYEELLLEALKPDPYLPGQNTLLQGTNNARYPADPYRHLNNAHVPRTNPRPQVSQQWGNIVNQPRNNFPAQTHGNVGTETNACPPGRPKIFCGFNPCDGRTCQLFPAAICIPDYCGDCKRKFTMANVDVTGACNMKL